MEVCSVVLKNGVELYALEKLLLSKRKGNDYNSRENQRTTLFGGLLAVTSSDESFSSDESRSDLESLSEGYLRCRYWGTSGCTSE